MSTFGTRTEGFFTWVWRVNGLLFLVLLAFGLLVMFNVSDGYRAGRNDVAMEGRIAPHGPSKPDLHLGFMRNLKGTPLLYAPLKAADAAPKVSFSGTVSAQVRNVLFFDLSTQQHRWLYQDNHRVISRPEVLERKVPATAADGKPGLQAVGLIFGTRPAANDPAPGGRWNIELASADGRQVHTLATDVDGMMGFHFTPDEQSLLVFYTARGSAHVLDVDLQSWRVLSKRKLATP